MSDTHTTGPTAEADDRGRGLPDIPGLPQVEVDKIVNRARTLYTHLVGGGLADLSRTPSEIIHDREHTRVYHYLPEVPVDDEELPVLLVPPVNTASSTFDLRRGNSLAEFLMQQGRPTYLVDYGDLSTRVNQDMGLEFWLDRVLPDSIRAVSEQNDGKPVHLVGWCLGGILSVFTHSDHPELPVASVAMVATPWDFEALDKFEPIRMLGRITGGKVEDRVFRIVGGIPGKINTLGFRFADPIRLAKKPYFVMRQSKNPDILAQLEAVDAMMDAMEAYPGLTIRQIYENFIRTSNLREGRMHLADGREVTLDGVGVPVMNIGGKADNIFAPIASTHYLAELLPDGDVTLKEAPGGHMGVLAGPRAAESTWRYIQEFESAVDAAYRDSASPASV